MQKIEVYATLLVLAIIFTTVDLVVSSCQLAIPSLIFSSITMIIGFVGAYLSKTIQVEQKYENAVTYIKRNFGIANIILSILDVFSCILALLTGLLLIMLVFRVTIAIRIAIYINKYRSVAFAVIGIAYMHLFKSFKRRKKMTINTAFQKILISIIMVFGASGLVVTAVPEFMGVATMVTRICGLVADAVAVVSGVWLGATHDKVLTEEEAKALENKGAQRKALKAAKAELKKAQAEQLQKLAEQKMQETQPK